ncbi:MAG TPA: peroxiredoxin [Marmoricola sp.]|nr:peroxiredoxin [Marmoricola sp.]
MSVPGLSEGSEAPDFELRDQHGAPVRLSSFRGTRNVLLVFYPYAFSRVCTGELAALRDAWPAFDRDDRVLLAVSCDSMFSLRAFAEADDLPFPLLSDFWPHGAVASAYGVLDGDRGCPRRSTFVVDRAGRVAWSTHSEMAESRNLGTYIDVLDALSAEK